MLEAFIFAFIGFVVLSLSTLGFVLLVAFFLQKRGFSTRVLLAAVLGPGMLIMPISLLAMGEGNFEASMGLLILVALACLFVGWPVAHLATRRLDRLIKFDIGTFE